MAEKLNYVQAPSRALTSGVSELWIIVRTGRAGTHMILLPGYNSLGVSALPNQTAAKHFHIFKRHYKRFKAQQ